MPFSFVDSIHHHGKGLGRAILPPSQCLNCLIIRGITSQEEPTQALNSYDYPLPEKPTGSRYGIGLVHHIALIIN
jgi:hypothetical protein